MAWLRDLRSPPASLFIIVTMAMWVSQYKPRLGQRLVCGALSILFLLCTEVGVRIIITPLERLTIRLASTRATGAQAIVVRAAGRHAYAPEYGGREIPDHIALARLRYGAKLYRETGLPILVSGNNAWPDGLLKPKALAMAAVLHEEFGVPVRWTEAQSQTTSENAMYSACLLKASG